MNPDAPQNPSPRPWVFLNAALTADGGGEAPAFLNAANAKE